MGSGAVYLASSQRYCKVALYGWVGFATPDGRGQRAGSRPALEETLFMFLFVFMPRCVSVSLFVYVCLGDGLCLMSYVFMLVLVCSFVYVNW